MITRLLATFGTLGFVVSTQAADISPSCLASFNVKDKTFETGNATMSCRLLEARRESLFMEINKLPVVGSIDGDELAGKLGSIEARLKELEGKADWVEMSLSVSGNALATIGLGACLETAGAGCALAIVGKVMSFVGIINSAVSSSEKATASAKLRAEIQAIQQKIKGKKPQALGVRSGLVSEFNGLCEAVKQKCL